MAMKEEDQIKERIRYQVELIKLVIVFLVATGGGVLSLLLGGMNTGREVIFTAVGIILLVCCIRLIYVKHHAIKNLIDNGK
jgi:hypothetical protein